MIVLLPCAQASHTCLDGDFAWWSNDYAIVLSYGGSKLESDGGEASTDVRVVESMSRCVRVRARMRSVRLFLKAGATLARAKCTRERAHTRCDRLRMLKRICAQRSCRSNGGAVLKRSPHLADDGQEEAGACFRTYRYDEGTCC